MTLKKRHNFLYDEKSLKSVTTRDYGVIWSASAQGWGNDELPFCVITKDINSFTYCCYVKCSKLKVRVWRMPGPKQVQIITMRALLGP